MNIFDRIEVLRYSRSKTRHPVNIAEPICSCTNKDCPYPKPTASDETPRGQFAFKQYMKNLGVKTEVKHEEPSNLPSSDVQTV